MWAELPLDWVVDYAATLARLNAAAGPEDAGALPLWRGPTLEDADSFLRLAKDLGAATPKDLSTELADLVHRLGQIEDYALLHGDPCPGNDIHSSTGIRFIDYEQASLGNAITELAYLRIGFPTYFCVLAPSEKVLVRAEVAYRREWRSIRGDDILGSLADSCAGWLIRGDALVARAFRGTADHLARLGQGDWTWGTATARERLLHRLTVLVRFSVEDAVLVALGECCRSRHDRMLSNWPDLKPLPVSRPSPL